jgi:hypothetical protein
MEDKDSLKFQIDRFQESISDARYRLADIYNFLQQPDVEEASIFEPVARKLIEQWRGPLGMRKS